MESKIWLIPLIIFICFIIFQVARIVYFLLKEPDKLQNMTDTTFDKIDDLKGTYKNQWEEAKQKALLEVEAEEEAKRLRKEEKKRQKMLKQLNKE